MPLDGLILKTLCLSHIRFFPLLNQMQGRTDPDAFFYFKRLIHRRDHTGGFGLQAVNQLVKTPGGLRGLGELAFKNMLSSGPLQHQVDFSAVGGA